MLFTYNAAGQKRLTIGEWFSLEKWPHNTPPDIIHLHFIIIKSGIEYRHGPPPHAEAAQVSALIFHAKQSTTR
ncbi:hypothetical protein HAP94_07970 [Acidithiobacillus ferrivorans]|nr:hypothetical protein [Acidithiobacillus ferrivorans]